MYSTFVLLLCMCLLNGLTFCSGTLHGLPQGTLTGITFIKWRNVRPVLNHTSKLCGGHIHYYSNADACFRISILRDGDVNPNPGPSEESCGGQGTPTKDVREHVTYNYSRDKLYNIGIKQTSRQWLPTALWGKLTSLGISYKKKTRRGKGRKARTAIARHVIPPVPENEQSTIQSITPILSRNDDQGSPIASSSRKSIPSPCHFGLWNARSLNNKVDMFCDVMIKRELILLPLQRHGCPGINGTIILLEKYRMYYLTISCFMCQETLGKEVGWVCACEKPLK